MEYATPRTGRRCLTVYQCRLALLSVMGLAFAMVGLALALSGGTPAWAAPTLISLGSFVAGLAAGMTASARESAVQFAGPRPPPRLMLYGSGVPLVDA